VLAGLCELVADICWVCWQLSLYRCTLKQQLILWPSCTWHSVQ